MIKPHILQSKAWQKFEEALGRPTIDKKSKKWQYMAYLEKGRFSSRLYCPYGPTVADKKALKEAVLDLATEAKKLNADFIRVEPRGDFTIQDLKNLGLKKVHNVQPANTLIKDVSASPEEILASLSQTARRYARKAEKAGVTYSVSYEPEDVKHFIKTINDVHNRTGMNPYPDSYYKTLATTLFPDKTAGLLLAWYEGKVVASIMFLHIDDTFSYTYAGNLAEYRKFSPAVGLGQFALLYAHELGCKYFDWYGIAPEGASKSHSWAGFTQFKLSFGGKRYDMAGTWELPLNRPKYALYRILLKLTGKS
ncbi:aminoacyltransferase [Ruminococcaceae bacterium OttesenSCG-928-A11]|nr:aminoacyltransferase [Ruminococcaceae bacterium OttesenSCG-928-A11]